MTTEVLAAIPSPPQAVWYLGPIPLRAYGICIMFGVLVALWLTRKRYVARGGNADIVVDATIVAVIFGIIGGRLYHVLTDYDQYFCSGCDPVDAFRITNGGLGIWGAISIGAIAVWAYFRYRKVPFAPFADAAAPGIILAQGIGRLGNWFNQELYGRDTDVPWALEIYYRVNDAGNYAPLTGRSTGEVIATVHPTFLYELVWNVLICLALLWADKRWRLGNGSVFILYVVGYCTGRFFIEQIRADSANEIFGVRINVWVSAIVWLLALIVFLRRSRKREDPKAVAGAAVTAAVATADAGLSAASVDVQEAAGKAAAVKSAEKPTQPGASN